MIIVIEIKVHFLSNFDYNFIIYNIYNEHIKRCKYYSGSVELIILALQFENLLLRLPTAACEWIVPITSLL